MNNLTGIEEYDNRYLSMINKKLKEYPHLAGYYAFISSNSSLSTSYNYLSCLANFKKCIDKPEDKLDIDDFTLYLASLKSKTSSYQINVYHALKLYGDYLVAKKILSNNPTEMIRRPKFKETQNTIKKRENAYLDEDDIKCMINNVTKGVGTLKEREQEKRWRERDLAIIYVLLNTGIRCSALYKLDINSVDLDKKVIYVTEKGEIPREITIADKTVEVLKEWIDKRKFILLGTNENALFVSQRRCRMSNNAISNIIKKYSVGINKKISPHKLRATFARILYQDSHDIRFVQKQMGHASSDTTDLYIRGMEREDNERKDAIIVNALKRININ